MTNRVLIGALHNRYLVPHDHPSPEDVRARLDDTARLRLGDACGNALERVLDPADPSVWFIRRLDLDLVMDAGRTNAYDVARFWSSHIAARLARTIAAGPDGNDVIRFEDRDDYVAHFAADIAGGRAGNSWYFRNFDGLRSLPPGAAIREALKRTPAHARRILRRVMALGRIATVFRAISERDANEILQCFESGSGRTLRESLAIILEARGSRPAGSVAHETLRLAIQLDSEVPVAHIETACRFAGIIERASARLLAAVAGGDLRTIVYTAREDGHAGEIDALIAVHEAAAGDIEWLTEMTRVIAPADAAPHEPAESFITEYGSIFLLLPCMVDAVPEEMLRVPVLRLLIAAECLKLPHASGALFDAAMLLAAGLDKAPGPDALEIDGATQAALPAAAATVLRAFTRRLAGFRESNIEFLWANLFAGQSSVVAGRDRIDVQLPAVPLRILLRFAGVHGQTYSVPWLGPRTVHLSLPED